LDSETRKAFLKSFIFNHIRFSFLFYFGEQCLYFSRKIPQAKHSMTFLCKHQHCYVSLKKSYIHPGRYELGTSVPQTDTMTTSPWREAQSMKKIRSPGEQVKSKFTINMWVNHMVNYTVIVKTLKNASYS
jgi:hypothetical protein